MVDLQEIKKSIEETQAELDKEFYEEYVKLAVRYKRSLAPRLIVARLTEEEIKKIL